MRCTWLVLLLVSCALAAPADGEAGGERPEPQPQPVATTAPPRTPPRTLDRKAAELAWRSWLQSPESGNQNAPPRRITTKSLFITPLVCPKGQRLDRNGCVQVVTVNKAEHVSTFLEQLNGLFTPAPNNGDVQYDYGDEDPGPFQFSIPIGLDPQATLQEPSAQAQNLQPSYSNVDKKGDSPHESASSIEAELELLKLQAQSALNDAATGMLSHNVMNNLLAHSDKPKRDSPMVNASDIDFNTTDEGQKEKIYGHVSVDPVIYDEKNVNQHPINPHDNDKNETIVGNNTTANRSESSPEGMTSNSNNQKLNNDNIKSAILSNKKTINGDESKLSPENDYSDIGEAIKLISRYAEVSTDDNFAKDQKKSTEDGILGTRTKLQYRRNKPKPFERLKESAQPQFVDMINKDQKPSNFDSKTGIYYRYPWSSDHQVTPPPDYPFRHLQDYWPSRHQFGGVYSTMHENPTRHHHSYPHYFRPRSYPYSGNPNNYPALPEAYQRYLHRVAQRNSSPIRTHGNNQELYSLLGLRHWFSNEDASKR